MGFSGSADKGCYYKSLEYALQGKRRTEDRQSAQRVIKFLPYSFQETEEI